MVVTLLVMVVLTIAVTAFMQSMSLERRTSHAYLNILKADAAVNAGLEKVKNILATETANDHFIIVKAMSPTNKPYYFIGTGKDHDAGVPAATSYTPLFTYLSSPSATPGPTPTPAPAKGPGASNNPPVIPTFANVAAGKPLATVDTSWETVETGDPQFPRIRYAYWAEDLAGYLDAGAVGNADGTNDVHLRVDGRDPKEISLFTLFDSSTDVDPGNTAAKQLISNRRMLLTPQSLLQATAQASPAPTPSIVTENLAAGLHYDTELETIPFGFGYRDAGKPKANLNTLLAEPGAGANVTAIAKVINDNLPRFNTAARKGSFGLSLPPQDYVKNLAANIVDYADTDNDATVGADYRGIDSYPFVTEHYTQFRWRNGSDGKAFFSEGGYWAVKVDVTLWIQLWNLSDKDITSGTLEWDDSGNEYAIFTNTNEGTPLSPEPAGTVAKTETFSPAAPLRKNEYRVIAFPTVSYTRKTGSPSSGPMPGINATATKPRISHRDRANRDHRTSNYSVLWNGRIVDRPGGDQTDGGGRIQRNVGTLNAENATSGDGPTWRGAYPGLRYSFFPPGSTGFGESNFNLGDPRSSYNMEGVQSAAAYNLQSSWYGRAYQYELSIEAAPKWIAAEATPKSWPDGGHDTAHGISIYKEVTGTGAAADRARNNKVPTDIPSTKRPGHDDRAPTHISNSGTYSSVLELGSIYDPAQWRPDWQPTGANTARPSSKDSMLSTWASLDAQPMLADTGAEPRESSHYGLSSSLRIGRGEFLTLDTDGTRAAQLLDLFTANANNQQSLRGRVNINTASRDVLRALYTGIALERDPDIEPASLLNTLYAPNSAAVPIVAADIFADTIIANRPYLSLAKLSHIRTSKDDPQSTASPKIKLPLFGNPKLWPASKQPTAWTDLGREEIFAKAFDLATVRSRNFRVYVAGQVLNAQGRVVSQSTKCFQLFVAPPRTASGAVDSTKRVTVKNLYESNL